MTIKSISYGGGVQSTAMIVLAVQGKIDAHVGLFANVGDDSEHPGTLTWVRDIMVPWCERKGFELHELHKTRRDGSAAPGLWSHVMDHKDPGTLREPIPIRGMNGAPLSRSCTADWKIGVVGKWLKAHGATADDPAQVNIGISTDEITRVGNKKAMPYEQPRYPLIDLGLSRQDCLNIIQAEFGKVPPKSSCFFCPFHRPQMWSEMLRDEPELFNKSVLLERTLNDRREVLGKDPVYLTRYGKPLDEVIGEAQSMLPIFDVTPKSPEVESCDEGYCWT